jgi:hypothetical protein
MAGHSRPKDGVAFACLCPAIHVFTGEKLPRRGCPAPVSAKAPPGPQAHSARRSFSEGGKAGHDELAQRLPIFSSTGSRWFKNICGSSLIGKWPRPFMMVTSQPAMLFATAIVSSGVQE